MFLCAQYAYNKCMQRIVRILLHCTLQHYYSRVVLSISTTLLVCILRARSMDTLLSSSSMHTHIVLSNNNIREYFYYGVCTLRAVYEYYVLLSSKSSSRT